MASVTLVAADSGTFIVPRNRSEKEPRLSWRNPKAIQSWARAVKHGESVGLTGLWFPDQDRDMDDHQSRADSKIARLFWKCPESDRVLLETLASGLAPSNELRIARANIILRNIDAQKQK